MPRVAKNCEKCKQFAEIEAAENTVLRCPECSEEWGKIENLGDIFEHCPVCGCRQFYVQKNFNQALGCLIMLGGIILVPWTYGLSLPVFALVDWLLYRKVPDIAVCYRCGCEFHGFNLPERFKPFMHHIGLKYDKDRK